METNVQPGSDPNTVVLTDVKITAPTKTAWFEPGAPTPPWALAVFRWFFWITSVVSLVVTTLDTDISLDVKLQIMKYVALANLVVHSLAKQFGLVVDTDKLNK